MARNKYPQETVDKILEVSLSLFLEQGYEHTTIQDIIDRLGGLTKGAIYHHFKSKEDIFYAIAERLGGQVEAGLTALRDAPGRTGLEKLKDMFVYVTIGSRQRDLNAAAPNMLDNPWLLAASMKSVITDVIPHYIYPAVLEGVADGSIQTDHPRELAEMTLLLVNIWLNPMIVPAAKEEVAARVAYCGEVFRRMGLELLDEEVSRIVTQELQTLSERL